MRLTPAKIYVAGHRGMVGSAIVRTLQQQGQTNFVTRTHAELDLTNQAAVQAFFEIEKPTQVYLTAAKVGDIHANNTYPAEFIYQNLMVQANVIDAAFRSGVQKLLFLGSSCIYPKLAPQPMAEDALLTRKWMDSTRINNLGWQAKVSLRQGLALAYQDFIQNVVKGRGLNA